MANYWNYGNPGAPGEENESLWSDWDPTRVSKTSAMKRYRLKAEDLTELTDVTTRTNPYRNFGGGTVHLYLIDEVEALAERKAQETAAKEKYQAEHKEEIEEAKKEKQREAKEQATCQAEQTFNSYKAVGNAVDQEGGTFVLPQEVLEAVMAKVVEGRVTGPADVARTAQELTWLSQVCTDFYRAVHSSGLPLLADKAKGFQDSYPVPLGRAKKRRCRDPSEVVSPGLSALRALPGPNGTNTPLSWAYWDLLVSDPQGFFARYKGPEVKAGLQLLGQRLCGTKVEQVVRLMRCLRLKGPAATPAKLLVAMREQRLRTQPWEAFARL